MQKPVEVIVLSNEENSAEKYAPVIRQKDGIVTFKQTNYLCAHYNAADLSMISNWAEIKEQNIDILKKSYTSLKVGIKCLGQDIHIRDTLLLSSAAASSLEAVGKAYNIKKVDIPNKE